MPGFNTIPGAAGGGGAGALGFVASVHMNTYNRSWAQAGTAGYYAVYSQNQESGYAYFVGSGGGTVTGVPLNRMINVSHAFVKIDIIAPSNDLISLYKVKVKATTEFANPFTTYNGGIASYPAVITSSGNFVLPNAALPMVNVVVVGGGGGAGSGHGGSHGGGGGGGGGNVVKLTAIQAVGTTGVTIGGGAGTSAAHQSGYTGGTTYFGNVYALGGGGGGGWSARQAPTGSAIGNTGGNGAGSSHSAAAGTTQSTLTGLGTQGAPAFFGGNSGGTSNPGTGMGSRGGGGAGSGGGGSAGGDGSGGNGGVGHLSSIGTGTWSYGPGGCGFDPNNTGGANQYEGSSAQYGAGGFGTTNGHSNGSGQTGAGGGTGAVVLRYYIP